mgnify:CR=1 FL=1
MTMNASSVIGTFFIYKMLFWIFCKKTDENIQILPRFVKKLEVYSAR